MANTDGKDLLTQWREATASHHREIESNMKMMSPDFSPEDYSQLLAGFLGFYEPFEKFLRYEIPESDASRFYLAERLKSPALLSDLQHLGWKDEDIARLPRIEIPAEWRANPAAVWGALYVIEGSTMGGQVIAKRLEEKFQTQKGFNFYRVYGENQMPNWMKFKNHALKLPLNEVETAAAVKAATQCFEMIAKQIQPSQA